jgi:hypothetical protein
MQFLPAILLPGWNAGMEELRTNRGGPLYWLKRRSWRFWFCVAILVPVLYVGSFGPACWLASRSFEPDGTPVLMSDIYWPVLWAWYAGLGPVGGSIEWFANVGAARHVSVGRVNVTYYALVLY